MRKKLFIFIALVLVTAAIFLIIYNFNNSNYIESESTQISEENTIDYRETMREWVITISTIAKQYNECFVIIPQNSSPLITYSGEADGDICYDFLGAIDGIGIEGITYGNNKYNKKRDDTSRSQIINMLDLFIENDKTVLVVDYCDDENKVEESINTYNKYGYIGYTAIDMELTLINKNIINVNDNDIEKLSDAKNWLILLNPERFSTKQEYISALSETNYDIIVIDAFYSDDEMLTSSDLNILKKKSNGSSRLVISYLSIGEAEDYRYYWQDEYYNSPPDWILSENSQWAGNYPVMYWYDEWQSIIATGENSYLKRIIDAGFDGVYLDIVDGYQTFED